MSGVLLLLGDNSMQSASCLYICAMDFASNRSTVLCYDAWLMPRFAEEHGISKASASYKELVEDPEVDIVYIGTITPLHKEGFSS